MKLVKMARGFIQCLFLWPVYLFSLGFPRSKSIWVFGSFKGTFVDNSKYLFLNQHIKRNTSSIIIPVWITKDRSQASEMRNRGYKSYYYLSLKGIFYCLRASLYIYSWTPRDINFWLSGGVTLVSLWHGIPFKKIGKDNNKAAEGMLGGRLKNNKMRLKLEYFLNPHKHKVPHFFLSTCSQEITSIFQGAFKSKNVINSLYPRVEHFIMPEKNKSEFIASISTKEEKLLLQQFKKYDAVWVYMPTFRDNKEDKKAMYSKSVFDFDKMNPILQKQNILLVVKYHYVAMSNIQDKDKYSHIKFLDSKMDMYVILPATSGLITDYSSIFFDYMLLNKPMLFYNFDMEVYNSKSREFYFPYADATCGPKISTFLELCNWFDNGAYKNYTFCYKPYIERFWGKTEKPYLLEQLYQMNHN